MQRRDGSLTLCFPTADGFRSKPLPPCGVSQNRRSKLGTHPQDLVFKLGQCGPKANLEACRLGCGGGRGGFASALVFFPQVLLDRPASRIDWETAVVGPADLAERPMQESLSALGPWPLAKSTRCQEKWRIALAFGNVVKALSPVQTRRRREFTSDTVRVLGWRFVQHLANCPAVCSRLRNVLPLCKQRHAECAAGRSWLRTTRSPHIDFTAGPGNAQWMSTCCLQLLCDFFSVRMPHTSFQIHMI